MYLSGVKPSRTGDKVSDGFTALNSKVLDMSNLPTLQQKTVSAADTPQPSLQCPIQPISLHLPRTVWLPVSSQGLSRSLLSNTPWNVSVSGDTQESGSKPRRQHEEQLSLGEMERKRKRRERNRLAAARCRNRRQQLIYTLQNETDQLEHEKAQLQDVIAELENVKEKLELILEAHRPMCKICDASSISSETNGITETEDVKTEPADSDLFGCSSVTSDTQPEKQKMSPVLTSLSDTSPDTSVLLLTPNRESLLVPVSVPSPFLTPYSTRMFFTFPSSPLNFRDAVASPSFDTSSHTCGSVYRHGSNNADQWSDYPLNSPTLLTL